ncbi:MAG: protein tyrosine phosphatase family protein [Planctomycetota bacterium]
MRTSALLLALLLGACAHTKTVTPPAPPAPLEPATLGALKKVSAAGGIWLAGQPSAEDLALLPALGVKTVINLRPAKEQADLDERAHVEGLGLAYVNVPFGSPAELNDGIFDELRRLLGATEQPLFLHCASANRVGAVWIPFRVLDQGFELEAAVAEAKSIGLKSPELEAMARDYVARHAPK